MEWAQVLTVIMANLAVFAANFSIISRFRQESREDWIRSQNTIDSIRDEMKDFHNRLCVIAEKREK